MIRSATREDFEAISRLNLIPNLSRACGFADDVKTAYLARPPA